MKVLFFLLDLLVLADEDFTLRTGVLGKVGQCWDEGMHGGMKELYPLTSEHNISDPNKNHHCQMWSDLAYTFHIFADSLILSTREIKQHDGGFKLD